MKQIKRASTIAIVLFIIGLQYSYTYGQKALSLEKIFLSYELRAKRIPWFNFMQDGRSYSKLENGGIAKYDFVTGDFVRYIYRDTTEERHIEGYEFSPDESKILLYYKAQAIYRRSFSAQYLVYDIKSKRLERLFDDAVMNPHFSPDGQKIAFVYKNNLYVKELQSGKLTQITHDGAANAIINGSSDWVYEEEFSIVRTFEWSPDSRTIAFLRFDESQVPQFTMTGYTGGLYPKYSSFKYPKVGEKNSEVAVFLYDMQNAQKKEISIPRQGDGYIPRIQWSHRDNVLTITRLNRHQNHLILYQYDTHSNALDVLLEEKNPYYIDVHDHLYFLKKQDAFVWMSEKSGYNQLYLYDMKGKLIRQLTKGNYDVTSVYGVSEKKGYLYFQTADKSPLQRSIKKVKLSNAKVKTLHHKEGTNDAIFSKHFDYHILVHSDANTAPSYTIYDVKTRPIRTLESNKQYAVLQKQYKVSKIEFFIIKTERAKLNAWMIKPPDFDETKKYPLLMYVYGGPGSQTVTDRFAISNYWWFQYLAQQGYIIVSVDNRGTGARGQEFKKMTYLQLGKYETQDQIAAAEYLADLGYIDKDRIGIFGWSYGGYLSSLCLLKGSHIFKSGIAVAPVTNWKWYDSIYTERYMRTLSENKTGYEENAPIHFADRLRGNYLIVHGMSDDNVHFQHTVEMIDALIKNGKHFESYIYPNRNHGIYGGNTRFHLFTKLTNFVLEKL